MHILMFVLEKKKQKQRKKKLQFVASGLESMRRQTGCTGSVSTCPPVNLLLANSHSSTVYDLRQHI